MSDNKEPKVNVKRETQAKVKEWREKSNHHLKSLRMMMELTINIEKIVVAKSNELNEKLLELTTLLEKEMFSRENQHLEEELKEVKIQTAYVKQVHYLFQDFMDYYETTINELENVIKNPRRVQTALQTLRKPLQDNLLYLIVALVNKKQFLKWFYHEKETFNPDNLEEAKYSNLRRLINDEGKNFIEQTYDDLYELSKYDKISLRLQIGKDLLDWGNELNVKQLYREIDVSFDNSINVLCNKAQHVVVRNNKDNKRFITRAIKAKPNETNEEKWNRKYNTYRIENPDYIEDKGEIAFIYEEEEQLLNIATIALEKIPRFVFLTTIVIEKILSEKIAVKRFNSIKNISLELKKRIRYEINVAWMFYQNEDKTLIVQRAKEKGVDSDMINWLFTPNRDNQIKPEIINETKKELFIPIDILVNQLEVIKEIIENEQGKSKFDDMYYKILLDFKHIIDSSVRHVKEATLNPFKVKPAFAILRRAIKENLLYMILMYLDVDKPVVDNVMTSFDAKDCAKLLTNKLSSKPKPTKDNPSPKSMTKVYYEELYYKLQSKDNSSDFSLLKEWEEYLQIDIHTSIYEFHQSSIERICTGVLHIISSNIFASSDVRNGEQSINFITHNESDLLELKNSYLTKVPMILALSCIVAQRFIQDKLHIKISKENNMFNELARTIAFTISKTPMLATFEDNMIPEKLLLKISNFNEGTSSLNDLVQEVMTLENTFKIDKD